ncbi:competence protein ComEA [Siansivirga zeaxanthinifaciens CC-SAMT-1]|uniref:Competence protein ComEA n=2 Tax=Siansivirga TaxID=1204360 RepID=A0A0C5W5F2_9FLAO|nr:competence protein ComEA [Siansivirga zeaxanthinifaciens CC-SAMT-1]
MNMKSHFTFTKKQRNGIFLLLAIIVVLQCTYFFINSSSEDLQVNNSQWVHFNKELDSLRSLKLEKENFKIKTYNPNYISDYKGTLLGMSNEEINRLINYRNSNKWINSVDQFQEVTQVSDSLLQILAPYFKFPDWINASKKSNGSKLKNTVASSFEKIDLNTATVLELQTVNGVGQVLANRIVRFRNKFPGGFIASIQLQDVYGLSMEVIERINQKFEVKTPRKVDKIHLNRATVAQLVTIQHIDYDLAQNIVEYRLFNENYKKLNELLKVKGFPVNKFDIIKLYLLLD